MCANTVDVHRERKRVLPFDSYYRYNTVLEKQARV